MDEARRNPLDRPLLIGVLVIHVLAVLKPVDVLFPVDAWSIGQRLLHGDIPYRDFQFEYPPLSALAFLLPGLAPKGLANQVLAVQAVALEAVAVAFIWRRSGAVRRYAAMSFLLFPFLAGGFDAFPMTALAVSTALLAAGRPGGWVVAAVGGMMKISPGLAWAWCRHHLVLAGLLLVVTAAVLLAPVALAGERTDDWLTYSIDRDVQVESAPATVTWLAQRITGAESTFEYRFKAHEIGGASVAAAACTAAGAAAMVWLAIRSRGRDVWWIALLAVDIFLLSSKVLSPQYFAWTAPLAAVVGGPVFVLHLVMAGLTVVAYTVVSGQGPVLAVAAIRNVILLGTVAWGLWRLGRPAEVPSETPAGPQHPVLEPAAVATRPA